MSAEPADVDRRRDAIAGDCLVNDIGKFLSAPTHVVLVEYALGKTPKVTGHTIFQDLAALFGNSGLKVCNTLSWGLLSPARTTSMI
jgi:hypothetical protein